jgi:hypothetical protein
VGVRKQEGLEFTLTEANILKKQERNYFYPPETHPDSRLIWKTQTLKEDGFARNSVG